MILIKMDINQKCLNVFKSFIKDINNVFPEYETIMNETYGSIMDLETVLIDDNELLCEFLKRVHKLNKQITNKDETIFESDNIILTNISFKELWNSNISYNTKEIIWKYLQTFCLLSINKQTDKDLQDALSDLSSDSTITESSNTKKVTITDKKVASNVKKIKKMTDNIKEPIAEEINNDPMESIINNSDIGKIAQQVSENINIEEMLGGNIDDANPFDLLQKMMSGDVMSQIMGNIHQVVNDKVDKGELNKDNMVKEAQNICSTMDTNPMFKNMQQNMAQTNPMQSKGSNKTRDRLKKKIKERENMKENSKMNSKVNITKVDNE